MKYSIQLLVLAFSFYSIKVQANETLDPCKKAKAIEIYSRQLDSMGVAQVDAIISADLQRRQDEARAKALAELLVQAQKIGKIKIANCRDLKVKGESQEARNIIRQIEEFCQEAPNNFWAELTADGKLRFSLESSTNGALRTLTIGGGTDLSISYRDQEIKFGGNISHASVGNGPGQSETFKYDAKVDYSIGLGIKNLKSFLSWNTDYQSSSTQGTNGQETSRLNTHTIAGGVRVGLINTDNVDLNISAGGGATYKSTGGNLSPEQLGIWTPTVVGALEAKVHATSYLTFYSQTSVQRDFHPTNPAWITAQTLGFDVQTGPVTLGIKGELSYDTNRRYAGVEPVGYSGMFVVGVSLGEVFGDKKAQEAALKARQREQGIWTRASEYAQHM